jgi:hypothetical protein
MPLSYDDLNREYRATLRREVQLRNLVDDLTATLLRMKARAMGNVQAIDGELQRMKRDAERNATANDVNRMNPLDGD